ncbi:MAG: UvrD-helicase domain-containing protein [Bacteroidales bacterium]|nr:UvrD-helicase domain-containing protein [Bacteroidales bacterium]
MDQSRFIICRAAAGSGKTYTLVREYLKLAFSARGEDLKKRFTRILAITFTNKAANEMKERIVRELDAMVECGTSCSMGGDIAREMGMGNDMLRQYADTVRKAILHNYSDFAVCTIDSFMHRLVRTFAHDLNLPMNFNVSLDNSEQIAQAVDDLMALAGSEGQEELTQVMCEFAESKMNEGKGFMIEREVAELAEELFKEEAPAFIAEFAHLTAAQFIAIRKSMNEQNRHYEQQMRELGQQGCDIINQAGLDPLDFFYGKTGAGVYFGKVADGSLALPNSRVLEYLEGEKLGGSKCSEATKELLSSVKPKLQEVHRKIGELREQEGKKYNTRKLMMKNLYSMALLGKMGELVKAFAHDNEIVHISDFNKSISRVVQDEPSPFIYERIGNRYYNYLIDEFQDTSRMQWQNLVPLLENGVSEQHTSLVVGDGKQAIYRFRQGDVGQFVQLPHVDSSVHGRLLESEGVAQSMNLDKNFRTAREVVEFNNEFFEWAVKSRFEQNAGLQEIYIGNSDTPDLCQKPTKEGGYVQLGMWDVDRKEIDKIWQQMLEDIQQLVGQQGYDYRDITILARKKSTLGEVSTYLTQRGVPVVSSESFLLTQSRVVMLLRSLLQYINDPSDLVSAMKVLQYLYQLDKIPCCHEEVFLNRQNLPSLDAILQADGLSLNTEYLNHLGLYDCCEESLRMLHLSGIETGYVATFLNVVQKYASNHRQNLPEFMEWFDKQADKLSTSTADDLNAVRMMTIHKSKGLESPVILYPIPSERLNYNSIWVRTPADSDIPLPTSLVRPKKGEPTLFDAEYNEECQLSEMDRVNLLYVALTRPKEKLMVYCQMKEAKDDEAKTDYGSLLMDFMGYRGGAKEVRDNVWCYGECSHKVPSHEEPVDVNNIAVSHLTFPRWDDRIAIAVQSGIAFGEVNESAIVRGTQMHELLSMIRSSQEVELALSLFAKRNHLEDEELDALAQPLHRMMAQPEVAKFFDPQLKSKNECDIVWQGSVLRPDRIVFAPDETWVIDFKTGAPKLDHREQVLRYCQVIETMGYPHVKGYLLYVGENSCQVIDV